MMIIKLLILSTPELYLPLSCALEKDKELQVVAVAKSCDEVLPFLLKWQPAVAILDLDIAQKAKLCSILTLLLTCALSTAVLLWGSDPLDPVIQMLLLAGAKGVLMKNDPVTMIVTATQSIAQGYAWLSPPLATRVLTWWFQMQPYANGLSAREVEVLQLLKQAHSNRQIACQLSISLATVKYHLGNTYRKLGVSSRTEAMIWTLNNPLVRTNAQGLGPTYTFARPKLSLWRMCGISKYAILGV
jgi:DNA-binding NarL/FixJ family response regulator